MPFRDDPLRSSGALTRLRGPHLDVRVSRVRSISSFAAQTRDVTGYDAGPSHVDEEVHRKVLSAPVLLRRPDRSGIFLSTFEEETSEILRLEHGFVWC